MPDLNPTKISRVALRNYKSIRECDVRLGPVTFLVGPNGSGKSNFVESLRFLSYALSGTLEQAVEAVSGLDNLVHRATPEGPVHFAVEMNLSPAAACRYSFAIAGARDGVAIVVSEECVVESTEARHWFRVNRGAVESDQPAMPAASGERLYLVSASGVPAFEDVYRLLSNIAVYNPIPGEIRGFKPAKRYRTLDRHGTALAETVFRMKQSAPERLERVTEYLRRITPGILCVDAVQADSSYTLRVELFIGGRAQFFTSQGLSDGTLRALAVLVALFQESARYPLGVVGLEEPESGLHPAAAAVLFDSLIEASHLRQVIVTSHSPDLLDRDDIPEDAIKAVALHEGRTIIGGIDESGRSVLRNGLYTAGELMRMDQLHPEGIPGHADVR